MSCRGHQQLLEVSLREFVRVIDEIGLSTPPPFNFRRSNTRPADDANATAKTSDGARPPRPSRRKNQPDTPPTPGEIQAFLHRLRKTSFRRKSKGFREWMKDIGAGDADGEDQVPK